MKRLLLVLCFAVPTAQAGSGCVIVKRGYGWDNYVRVESSGVDKPKHVYSRKALAKLEDAGVQVEILDSDYTKSALTRARAACSDHSATPVSALKAD